MIKCQNEKGITLAELLAALAIGSIVVVITLSVFITFNKQYDKQSDEIRGLTNVSTAAQAITKQIRSAEDIEISDTKDKITISLPEETVSYHVADNTLMKNNQAYLSDIDLFEVNMEEGMIHLKIHSSADQQIETTIALRKEGGTP